MITLFATSSDGWSLARDGSSRWLVRPPYGEAHRYQLTLNQVARMLMDGGFEPVRAKFEGWDELYRDLEQRRVAAATPEELEAAKDAAERLLKRANPRQAARHLERIESELENDNVKPSKKVLEVLLCAPAVENDPELYAEALRLLDQANRTRPSISR